MIPAVCLALIVFGLAIILGNSGTEPVPRDFSFATFGTHQAPGSVWLESVTVFEEEGERKLKISTLPVSHEMNVNVANGEPVPRMKPVRRNSGWNLFGSSNTTTTTKSVITVVDKADNWIVRVDEEDQTVAYETEHTIRWYENQIPSGGSMTWDEDKKKRGDGVPAGSIRAKQ
ncbi:MAG: hypothetical protein CMJ46_02810 [Planctomyces sp.]|nr:hypothetical protein [Planctomyces sp.]